MKLPLRIEKNLSRGGPPSVDHLYGLMIGVFDADNLCLFMGEEGRLADFERIVACVNAS